MNLCHSLLTYYQERNEQTAILYGLKLISGTLQWTNWQKSSAHVNMLYNESCHGQHSFLLVIMKTARIDLLSSSFQWTLNLFWKVTSLFCCLTMWAFETIFTCRMKAETSLLPFSILGYGNSCNPSLSSCFFPQKMNKYNPKYRPK